MNQKMKNMNNLYKNLILINFKKFKIDKTNINVKVKKIIKYMH